MRDGSRGKPATRRMLLARRDGMAEPMRVDASGRIAERASQLVTERLVPGAVVALYAAKASEVETIAIDRAARDAGLRVAYPRVLESDRVLAFHVAERTALIAAPFGLIEPSATSPAVGVDAIAAFVVPGIAFDRAGGRIGWGRGHYDATFALARPDALRIGLAFECQLVDRVPREAHDASLHFIVTEDATYVV